jgi:hypothetical protein
MKNKSLCLFALVILALNTHAQSTNKALQDDLRGMKKVSQVHHVAFQTNPSSTRIESTSSNTSTMPGGCNCLLNLDSTFSYVPFSQAGGAAIVAPFYLNDDGSTASIPLPFDFHFFGDTMHSFYINNNGNISFITPNSIFSGSSFPNAISDMIAPFWSDVDTRGAIYDTLNGQLIPQGKVMYKLTATALIVRWEKVGYYNQQNNMLNTFQVIITDGNDPLVPGGNNVSFCYGDMQWTNGSSLCGFTGLGLNPSMVGINKGDGIHSFQLSQCIDLSNNYDGGYNNLDGVNYLDSQSFYFNTNTDTTMNVPPIDLSNLCDTIIFAPGDSTEQVMISFGGPEMNDSVSIQLAPNPNAQVISNVGGDYAVMMVQVNATSKKSNNNTLLVTATDSHNQVTTQTYHIADFVPSVLTGIESMNISKISIYPNPSDGKFMLSKGNANKLKVLDILGSTILETKLNQQVNEELDLSQFPNGIYWVQFINGNESITQKIIKQ